RRRHTISYGDWSSDVCSSDLERCIQFGERRDEARVRFFDLIRVADVAGCVEHPGGAYETRRRPFDLGSSWQPGVGGACIDRDRKILGGERRNVQLAERAAVDRGGK